MALDQGSFLPQLQLVFLTLFNLQELEQILVTACCGLSSQPIFSNILFSNMDQGMHAALGKVSYEDTEK